MNRSDTTARSVVSVNPPQLRAVLAFLRRARRLARAQPSTPSGDGFGIPFVDYARGDGVAIGAGHDAEWSPVLIDDATMWVWAYRGLWGLDTRDRFGGERAPAGPRYERDGSVRSSWANPLGWAGLLTVAPRETDVADLLAQRVAALDRELRELDAEIEAQRGALRGLRVEARSLANYDHTRSRAQARRATRAERELALNQAIATRAGLADERQAHLATLSGRSRRSRRRRTSANRTSRIAPTKNDARGFSSCGRSSASRCCSAVSPWPSPPRRWPWSRRS
jgi:hypothetical protein